MIFKHTDTACGSYSFPHYDDLCLELIYAWRLVIQAGLKICENHIFELSSFIALITCKVRKI